MSTNVPNADFVLPKIVTPTFCAIFSKAVLGLRGVFLAIYLAALAELSPMFEKTTQLFGFNVYIGNGWCLTIRATTNHQFPDRYIFLTIVRQWWPSKRSDLN